VAGADQLRLAPSTPLSEAWAVAKAGLALSDSAVAQHVASRFHLRLANLAEASPAVVKLVPETVVRKHRLLPLREDDREIVVATADPTDLEAEQAIAFASGRQVVFEIAPPGVIDAHIERRYAPGAAVEAMMERVDTARADAVRVVDEMAGTLKRAQGGESGAVAKLTNLILRAAIDHRANAIEIAHGAGTAGVLLLVDGVWTRFMQLSVPVMNHVIARLRVLGNVGIANRMWSRDGGARIRIEGRTYDLRLQISAPGSMKRALIRIYDQSFTPRIADLLLTAEAEQALREALTRPGLMLLAIPPDAGGGTLLYAILRELAAEGRRVVFAEDVLRWDLHGVEHASVEHGTAANAIQAAAARDVDVIVAGAVPDAETALALVRACRPGRLVIARVEAESAAAAVRDLAVQVGPAALADALRTLVSVRLLRRTCERCQAEAAATAQCEVCRRTGYRGVLPLLAVLPASRALSHALHGANPQSEIAPLLDDASGLRAQASTRIARGESTEEEAGRALQATEAAAAEPVDRPLVLVADDDALIRLLARTVLETDGLTVIEAEDGVEALERLAATSGVSLVVVDLDMPRLNGHGVVAEIKRDVKTAGVPVVVLTASTNPIDEARALERGADDYIRKPIDPPRFLARIRAVLRRSRG
jgi:type II secretory ATPase GspE/PulE/Tfp pilus assembly ATPase PilB-like protein/ActR/RegA family two-component response regulator